MVRIDKFLLMSGEDIPFMSANIIIHNPTIQEITKVFLYENNFLTGFEFLFFSKDKIGEEEQRVLAALSDYEILITLLNNEQSTPMKKQIMLLKKFLQLLFNNYEIEYREDSIVLKQGEYICIIDENLFNQIKDIVKQMFPFKNKEELDFNPQNERARQIAEKIKKGKAIVEKEKRDNDGIISLFEKYISILTIGLQIPINELYQCTVFQLFNMFERYEKKLTYDVHLQAQLAGATGMKQVDHWMM